MESNLCRRKRECSFRIILLLSTIKSLTNAADNSFCPGYPVQFSCNSSNILLWSGTVFNEQCSAERILVENDTSLSCGQINTTNSYIPDSNFPQVTLLQSNLIIVPTLEMMGATIRCTLHTRIPLDTTLNLIDITVSNISSKIVNNSHQQFFWSTNSAAVSCNLTHTIEITRLNPPNYSLSVPKASSGHIIALHPGTYNYVLLTSSGAEEVFSNTEQFLIMNKPPPPFVRATSEGKCFIYTTMIYVQPYVNETTPQILSYTLTIGDDEEITLSFNSEVFCINTSMMTQFLHLNSGRLKCFSLSALNKIGLGEPSYACINVPPALLSIDVKVTKESAVFNYTVDITCATSGTISATTEIYNSEQSNRWTNQSLITNSIFQHEILNLLPGVTYRYCVIFNSTYPETLILRICDDNLPNQGMFTTDKPNPPEKVNGAVLLRTQSNQFVYECRSKFEKFDDGSVVAVADFDASTQMYSINGSCTGSEFATVTTISVIVTALSSIILGAFLASLLTYQIIKKRALKRQWQQHVHEDHNVLTNEGAINRSFEMEDNMAYGPIRKYSMEENAAYVSRRS